jgi:hypothetical protein
MCVRLVSDMGGLREMGHKIEILGFKGSYSGDNLRTMKCPESSVLNEKVEWY